MLPHHVYNKNSQRFETLDKLCSCCELNEMEDISYSYYTPLFKIQDRTNVIVYRSVKYSKVLIGMPRCASCYQIHHKSKNRANLISWIIAPFIVVLAILTMEPLIIIFGIIIGILFGIFGGLLIKNKIITDSGILTEAGAAKTNETIQDLVISGWSLTQPST